MNSCVVFNGISALDFEELRANAIRIPEVLSRVRQAQKIWGDAGLPSFDFVNFIGSENKVFYANIKFKSLAAAIVQIGLYERYVKKNKEPSILLGTKTGDSPMMYMAGDVTYPELVLSSQAACSMGQGYTMPPSQKLSASVNVSQLSAYQLGDEVTEIILEKVSLSQDVLSSLIRNIIDKHKVKKFINIGPGSNFASLKSQFTMEDLLFLESVDCDPMLSWFWKHLNPLEFQVAQ